MTPHATEAQTNGDMSNDSAPLTNGETPRSRALSVRQAALLFLQSFTLQMSRKTVDQRLSQLYSPGDLYDPPKRGCCMP